MCWYTDLCHRFLSSVCGMALACSHLHDHASHLDVTDASMEVVTVSNGSDRGRVYMEEQATRLQHGDNGANVEIPNAEQSIIVHEQSQPPWVPSPGATKSAAIQTMMRRRGFLRLPRRRRTL